MKKTFLTIVLLSVVFQSLAQIKTGFSKTWVFAVGVLEWADKQSFEAFDKEGRVDAEIIKFFSQNGIPTNQIMYIQDKKATTKYVKESLAAFVKNAKIGDNLFFYYCGHGYKNDNEKVCFANYQGAEWTAEDIVKTVNANFAGSTAFFVADCCNSGALADEVKKYPKKNFVALNSVIPADVSTGNWTFSNALLYGLKGLNFVDLDNNQKITLNELANYIDKEMAIVEGQKSAFYIPKTMTNWVVTTNVPAKKNSRIGEHVNVEYDKEDYLGFITDVKNNQYKIRYYSYTNDEVEWIEGSEMKPFRCEKDFAIGATVKVYDDIEEDWFPAKVLKKFSCLHYIHYIDYGNEFDTWVGPSKIKK